VTLGRIDAPHRIDTMGNPEGADLLEEMDLSSVECYNMVRTGGIFV
jgi:hypothetical protein